MTPDLRYSALGRQVRDSLSRVAANQPAGQRVSVCTGCGGKVGYTVTSRSGLWRHLSPGSCRLDPNTTVDRSQIVTEYPGGSR